MTKISEFSTLKWGALVGVVLSLTIYLIPWRIFAPKVYQEYTNNWKFEFEAYSHPRVYNHQDKVVLLNRGQPSKVIVLNKMDGKLLWETEIGWADSDVAPPVFDKENLCLLVDEVFNVWDLSSGDLVQKFDLMSLNLRFDYYQPPVFWRNKDSLIIKSKNDGTYLKIGSKNYSLQKTFSISKNHEIIDSQQILWMKEIEPQKLKDYNLANFKKIPPFWYNLKDSVFIDWYKFGDPLEVVSDSQMLIKIGDIVIRKWDFKNDTIEWKQTLGNGVQAEYLYHRCEEENLWLLWKHNGQVAFMLFDLQSGKTMNHGVSSVSVNKTFQHQKTFSFITTWESVIWVDFSEPTNYIFKQYNIKDFESIVTTIDENSIYVVSEQSEQYTEPRSYELNSYDRKNIE